MCSQATSTNFGRQGDRVLDPLDVFIAIPLWKKGRIIIGKQKEPFIYELVGDSPNLPHQERLLNAFFEHRNIGVKYQDNYVNDRISFSLGVFNDWFKNGNSFGASGPKSQHV